MDLLTYLLAGSVASSDLFMINGTLDLMIHMTRLRSEYKIVVHPSFESGVPNALANVINLYRNTPTSERAYKVIYNMSFGAASKATLLINQPVMTCLMRDFHTETYAMLAMVMLDKREQPSDNNALLKRIFGLMAIRRSDAIPALARLTGEIPSSVFRETVYWGIDDILLTTLISYRASKSATEFGDVLRVLEHMCFPLSRKMMDRIKLVKNMDYPTCKPWDELCLRLSNLMNDTCLQASSESGKQIVNTLTQHGFVDKGSLSLLRASAESIGKLGLPLALELRLVSALDSAFAAQTEGFVVQFD